VAIRRSRVELRRFGLLEHKRAIDRKGMRRYRRRLRNGAKLLVIEIANAAQTIDSWVALGLLSEEQRNDKAALEAALDHNGNTT
jgi:hypothetical protein